MHPLPLILLALALATAPAAAAPPLTLDAAEAKSLERHPSLAELTARIRAAEARSVARGRLPDPRLSVGAANVPVDSFDLEQEPMTQLQIGLHQDFPPPGSLELRAEREAEQGTVYRARRADTRADLVRRVRLRWLERFYLDRALAVVDDNLALFEELLAIARSQYRVGKGLQQEVLLAELERDRLRDRRDRLQRRQSVVTSRLAELMAGARADYQLADTLPELPSPPQRQALLDQIPRHPAIRAADARIQRQQTAADLAEKAYYPAMGVDVTYGHRPGAAPDGDPWADFVSAQFRVSLPLFTANRQDRELAAALAERDAARRQEQRQLLMLQRRARSQYAAWRAARRRAERYSEVILPGSEQNVASAEAAYTTGKLDFLDLVRARIEDFEHHLKRWRVRVDAAQARADLLYLASQGSKP